VIDLRLWRAGLLAVAAALIVAMFSLEEVPDPLRPAVPPDAFDSDAARSLTRELASSHPDPRPGSEQDEALAELVKSRFTAIGAVQASEQLFDAEFGGEDVELRNLIAVLPGASDRQVALIAHRDVADGSGAGSSLASTAVLLEIASGFAGSTHEKSLVFVSTDGGSIGALGARRFIRDYSDAGLLDGAVVLSQPAAADPVAPLVIPWSTGPQSTGAALAQTADETVSEETEEPAGDEGPLGDLFRLALPSALGEQGPLIEAGLDSVRLSSSGELPLPPERDEASELDGQTIGHFGRAALSLMLGLDAGPSPPEHGPEAHIGLAGNLLPGWTLGLLALALLAPVGLVAGEGVARIAHSPVQAGRALGWALLRSVPFLFGLVLVYALSLVGLIPSPEFPFDPRTEGLGLAGAISVAVAFAGAGAVAFLLRPLLPPPPSTAGPAPAAALTVAALAALGVWAINPYLGLLIAIGLQLWVLAASGLVGDRLRATGLVLAGLVPVLAAVLALAGRFDAGLGVVWDLMFMFTGGQLNAGLALLGCLLGGSALAIVATNGPAPAPDGPQMKLRALVDRGRALEERRAERQRRAADKKRQSRRARMGLPEDPREELLKELPPEDAPAEETPADDAPAESEEEPPKEPKADAPQTGTPGGEAEDVPADEAPAEGREEPPDQPDPAPDPRMWSKPSDSSLRPSVSLTVPGSPSVASPILVSG
jgi:hypothetical protein